MSNRTAVPGFLHTRLTVSVFYISFIMKPFVLVCATLLAAATTVMIKKNLRGKSIAVKERQEEDVSSLFLCSDTNCGQSSRRSAAVFFTTG
ncbi:hypothetical protein IG631_14264 [Alternaria alternata]|jgi:hypothetical protein|nr:hypothetical protein IG631_14264 [Alternaria alternata]